jgi:iron-sulfur cluster assembly protein
MIYLSDKAADKVQQIMKNESKEGWALRVGIKGGGCSGFTYTINFDKEANDNDQIFEDKGVKILVDPKSFIFLTGTQLDYVDSLTGAGFTFSNPNATKTCGCGTSFQA